MDRNVSGQGTVQQEPGREQRFRAVIFEEYPEIGNFMRKKKRLGYFLMVIGVAVFLLRAVAAILVIEEFPVFAIAGALAGYCICFAAVAFCCMAARTRGINMSSVIAGGYLLYHIVNWRGFGETPLGVASDLIFAVYTLTVFITSLVLALTPKFRGFMVQYEETLFILMEKALEEENVPDKYWKNREF
ncbi:MAG: hypothetical protein NC307_03300 [Roseburia sp.]|nr:hypothetical protein [Roseburia sp.]